MRDLIFILFLAFLSSFCEGKDYPYRWVFADKWFNKDSDVEDIKSIVKTASEHGLNGMVLWGGLDRLYFQPPSYFRRLEVVKQICEEHNVEIIPMIFSVGMGGSVLAHDKNLAAGLPVRDAFFIMKDGKAHLVPDPAVEIVNGGFEKYAGNNVAEYEFHDKPGKVSFIDTQTRKSEKVSLRFENFGKYRHGHARVMQQIKVHPYRCYRLSCWVRTKDLEPLNSLRMLVLSPDGRTLVSWRPDILSTNDWRRIAWGFNSLEHNKVRVYIGAWGGKSGKFWVDDLAIEEVGLLNVLRRPGTPVTVKGEEAGMVYEEGKDFTPIRDPNLNFRFDHEPAVIDILPASRIKNGEHLRVSYYHGMETTKKWQVGVCMSEPKLYEIWTEQAKLIHKHLAPSKYFLSMDEIRAGGTCEACKGRNMTMAQILGDCITKQVQIIRTVNPQAEVLIWSDMLDPSHNARDKYYLVEGDFNGSWEYVPKDLIIVCWSYDRVNHSIKFFSSLGFRTLASACHDGGTLDITRRWLEVLDQNANAFGIMYTTWKDKYELLVPFADTVTATE